MRIYANSYGEIVLSESKLRDQFTEAIENYAGCSADDCFTNIKIQEDQSGVTVDIEAEIYFDQQNEVMMDYDEYRDCMIYDCGLSPDQIQTRSEFYESLRNQPTLVDKMDEILKQYNPDWYFELYDACHIQAYLDNCILEA